MRPLLLKTGALAILAFAAGSAIKLATSPSPRVTLQSFDQMNLSQGGSGRHLPRPRIRIVMVPP
jgi:hypothetical protein